MPESLAGFHSELSVPDLLPQKRMRTRSPIQIRVEYFGNVEREIEADEIRLLHRAEHGHAGTRSFPDHDVDGLGVADTGGNKRNGLSFERVLQAVADKTRHVAAHMHRCLPGIAQQL